MDNPQSNQWQGLCVRPSASFALLLLISTTASLTVSLSHAKPVAFNFAWGNTTATVDEKVTQVLSGALMQYTWTYQIRLQQEGQTWVLSASAPVLSAEPTVVPVKGEKKSADMVNAVANATTVDANASVEKIIAPPHPILPMPAVVIDASGNVIDFAAVSPSPVETVNPSEPVEANQAESVVVAPDDTDTPQASTTVASDAQMSAISATPDSLSQVDAPQATVIDVLPTVQQPVDVPTDDELAQAEQLQQRLDQIRVFWCQWSCPWAGRSLELNQAQQDSGDKEVLHHPTLIDESVTYKGPYKKGPQVAMSYQAMIPAKGTELAALIAQFPRYPQSIGPLYQPATGPTCPANVHGQRWIQIDAVVSPKTLRPTSVKSVTTLEMVGPEGYTYTDVVTRDYQFKWSTP